MSIIKEKIKKLKELAEQELEFCDEVDTPYVCQMITTESGKKKVIDQIVELVGKRSITISDAIVEIEQTANPQNID